MWVVGTAGHVDHGKSTLVEALTGTDPDRLKEEKIREMTIELGFAWLTLPGGEAVGIVDVPGHRDFIENMLAGVGGIDAVLLVIAADEGIMPQTREHLAILDLLQVKAGIIVLSKVDLAPDEEWLQLVEHEIREFCTGSILESAPLVRVSARTGAGIDTLKNELAALLAATPERKDLHKPRLAIDRVFTISGYGTVVTGTLIDGTFKVGDEVQILPSDLPARIRGIQTYNQKVTVAPPGTRTALNLSGIDRTDIKRGDVVVHPGDYSPTARLDAQIQLLRDAESSLKHNAEIKFFIGATEVAGRIRVLGSGAIPAGAKGFVQVEMEHPVVAVKGDRFILRRPSPPATIAGGVVLDSAPEGRYKLNDPIILERLGQLTAQPPEEELLAAFEKLGVTSEADVLQISRIREEDVLQQVPILIDRRLLVVLGEGKVTRETLLVTRSNLDAISAKALEVLRAYHLTNPLRRGMPREEFKSKLRLRPVEATRLLQLWIDEAKILQFGQWLSLPDHAVTYTPAQQKKIAELLSRFDRSPFSPPGLDESVEDAGELLVNSLIETGELVKVAPDVIFRTEAIKQMSAFIRDRSGDAVPFTVGEFRDRFQTSRKYSLAFLEYLDEINATRREGDGRIVVHPENLPG